MKKLYSFLASALLTAFAASAQVTLPYTAPIPTADPADGVSDSEWTRATTKGASWALANAGNITYEGSAVYGISGANATGGQTDSWLISPTFACKESTEYKITFSLKKSTTATSIENLDVYLTMLSPVNNASTVIEWYDGYYKSVDLSAVTTKYAEFSVTIATDPGEQGNFYFAFRAHGAHTGFLLGIVNITIEELSSGSQEPEKPEQPEQPGEHICAGKSVPYASTIAVSGSAFDEGWSQINGNEDNKKWEPATGSTGGSSTNLYAQYTYNSNAPDDYLVSPAIHLEAGKEYKVLYGFMTKKDKENVTVYASEGDTKEEILAGDKVHEYLDYSQQTFAVMNDTYVPAKTGDYHFTFHVHSVASRWNIYVSEFKVLENVFAPAGVSDLTVTPAPARELRCTVSWTLPTTSVFGDPLTEEQTIEKIEIFRDGGTTAIATLGGDATSFDDTEATGLTSGKHTYSVVVTVAGAVSPATTSALSSYVGPIAPAPVPVEFTFESQEDLDLSTFIDGPDHYNTAAGWNYYSYTQALRFSASYTATEDSWYISRPIAIAEPGYYRVTINQKVESPAYSYKYEYAVGKAATIEAMQVRADNVVLTGTFADYFYDFYADEAGTYYVGIHANDQSRSNAQHLSVGSIKVEASTFVPGAATDLSLTPAADGALSMTLTWTAPTTSFAGDAMTAEQFKTEIYLGDELYTTLDGSAPTSLEIPLTEAGIYTVTVKTVGLDGATAPTHPSVKSAWVGPKTVVLPYDVKFNDSGDATLNFWDAIDGNADGKTWTIQSGTYKLNGATRTADGLYEYNDYLLSPETELTAGSTYRVTFTVKGGNYTKFYFNVGAVKAGSFNPDHTAWAAREEVNASTNGNSETKTWEFTVDETALYRIVFAADELQSIEHTAYYQLAIVSVGIKEVVALPDIATDVTVTPGANYALEAEIAWTNPTATSFEGVTLDAGDITEARIYRNGTEVGSVTENLVPGTRSTFTDYELATPGNYTYKVVIYTANGCSETPATEVKSAWIGGGTPIPATQAGLEYGIYSSDNFETWSKYSAGGSGKVWETSGSYGLTIVSTSSAPDAWAISRPIQFEPNCVYEIEINSRYDYNPGTYLASPEVYYGTSEDHTGLSKIGEWSLAASATNNTSAQTDFIRIFAVDPAEIAPAAELEGEGTDEGEGEVVTDPTVDAVKVAAGPSRLAFHAKDRASTYIRWCNIRLVKSLTGIDAAGVTDGVEYDGYALRFEGSATVEVYDLAGALVAADAAAQGSFDLTPLAGGIYIVKVSPQNGKAQTMKIMK